MKTENATSNIRLTGPEILVGRKMHRRTQKSPHTILEYLRWDMKSIYSGLALSRWKNECARTDTVSFPIAEVNEGTVSLNKKEPGAWLVLNDCKDKVIQFRLR